MSKYKVKFYISTGCVISEIEEDIDLVEDYGFSEEEAKEIFEDKEKVEYLFNDWLWEKLDAGWKKLEEENE